MNKNYQSGFIQYVIVIGVILGAVFLSQQSYAKDFIKKVSDYVGNYGGASLSGALKASDSQASDQTSNQGTKEIVNANLGASYDTHTGSFYKSVDDSGVVEQSKWSIASVPAKIIESVKSGGEKLVNGVVDVKEKISENILQKTENYFSNVASAISGKNISQTSCPPTNSNSQ